MRRIAIGTTALALVAHLIGCAADAPTAPPPGGGGNTGALEVSLFTNDPNPPAGSCSLVQAIATFNGADVPDGTSIAFSTDLGTFSQNSQPTISVVTSGGAATTSLCSLGSGVASVRASATVQGRTDSANLAISFQSSPSQASVNSCSPTFGTPTGGTALVLNGSGFAGSTATTRVFFNAAGVTREGLVTGVTSSQISVVTPAFPEATSLSVPVQIQIVLGVGTSSPTTLTAPSCFVFSTAPVGTPTVAAVLPSSGRNEGNTRVSIIGSGFLAPVQVFFGAAEATVLTVSFNQIVALSPPASGIGAGNLNQTVDVRVKAVSSGQEGTLAAAFRYGPGIQLIATSGANVQSASQPFRPLTIHGQGFEAPVQVGLAGFVATVISVSATEIVVVPGNILVSGCADISGQISVTNITTGDTASGLSFTYVIAGAAPVVTGVSPTQGQVPVAGIQLLITGANLPTSAANARVTVGGNLVTVIGASAGGTALTVQLPPTTEAPPACGANPPDTLLPVGAALDVTVTNVATTCTTTFTGAFQYLLPCVP
jgi:hypothetical protein